MFYLFFFITISFITILYTLGPAFVRANEIEQHSEKLMSGRFSMHTIAVLHSFKNKEVESVVDILKQTPRKDLYLIQKPSNSDPIVIYNLSTYNAILNACQIFEDYNVRDRFSITV